jgi:hypothetical protein
VPVIPCVKTSKQKKHGPKVCHLKNLPKRQNVIEKAKVVHPLYSGNLVTLPLPAYLTVYLAGSAVLAFLVWRNNNKKNHQNAIENAKAVWPLKTAILATHQQRISENQASKSKQPPK